MLKVGSDELKLFRVCSREDDVAQSMEVPGVNDEVHAPLTADASQVVCFGDGLSFGYYGIPVHAVIDVRKAGPGELTVFCDGPTRKALCELRDPRDGFFKLAVEAKDVGNHLLYIKYDETDVPGSPFLLRVSPASLIRVHGPGLQHGVLSKYKAQFTVDLGKVGPGELTVRIGGPRGAFKVKTRKHSRSVICSYKPKEPGTYVIHVYWADDPVPKSPFHVFLAANKKELAEKMAAQSNA